MLHRQVAYQRVHLFVWPGIKHSGHAYVWSTRGLRWSKEEEEEVAEEEVEEEGD